MTHSPRRAGIALISAAFAACVILGCTSKPPTPIISGPDSGWVRAPVRFRAFEPDGNSSWRPGGWRWGDGEASSFDVHAYAAPGIYSIVYITANGVPGRVVYSDPSAPCTLRILDDTLVFPDTLVDTVQIGYGSTPCACVVPDGSRIYVVRTETNSVNVIETQTNSVVATVAVQDSPVCCAVSSSGEQVYVLNAGSGTVSIVRTSDNMVTDTIDVGSNPNGLAVLPNDSLLYVGYADTGLVAAYRPDNESCVARVALPDVPSGLAVKPGGEYVFVPLESANCVTAIRVSDNTVTSSTTLNGGPVGCAFSQGGETAYVPCPSSYEIALLRASDLGVTDVINYDSMMLRNVRYVTDLSGGPCFYGVAPVGRFLSLDANCVVVVRRSDNYLLRIFYWEHTGVPGPAIALPDRSRVYVPTSKGVFVLGLRPGR